MGRKSIFAVIAVVLLVAMAVVGTLAYDGAQKGKIAEGVTIEGVDVGGMDAAAAEAKVRRELLRPFDRPLHASYRKRTWTLAGGRLKVRADIHGAVEKALAASREGDLPTRLGRYLGGDELDLEIGAHLGYSRSAINLFVRRVAADIDRAPRDASVSPGAAELRVLAARPGRKLRDVRLTRDLRAAVSAGECTVGARVHRTAPEVSTAEISERYPSDLTLDRGSHTLRLWKGLELARTYFVAVGQEGLGTPEGLHEIEAMEEEPELYGKVEVGTPIFIG